MILSPPHYLASYCHKLILVEQNMSAVKTLNLQILIVL